MVITDEPWRHPDPGRSSVRLVEVAAGVVHELARGEGTGARQRPLTAYLRGDECRSLWRMRSAQIAATPGDAPWVTRFVVVPGEAAPVGLAGFHGPPDEAGMVEIGYRIDPAQRRKGYARQSVETLLAVARAHPDVRVIRATMSPDNEASRSIVESYGFLRVGEQWDDEAGLEIVFEVTGDPGAPAQQNWTADRPVSGPTRPPGRHPAARPSARDLPPRQQDAMVGLVMLGFSAAPDLVVTVVRAARGRRGVQFGPTLAAVGIAAVAPGLLRRGLGHEGHAGAVLRAGALLGPVVLPGLAVHPATVVGHGSPWWSLVVSGTVRGMWAGVFAVVSVRGLRARRAGELSGG